LEALTFYKGKKVLVTGHTGFKGSWLSIWLNSLGADVIGYALDPESDQGIFELSGISKYIKDYRGDIRNKEYLNEIIEKEQPEMVFHLAAQPLVIDSYADPVYTFEVNSMGTAYLLDIMRTSKVLKTAVIITTDKVYKNEEWIWPYREDEKLGGHDPYSASKAAAELVLDSFRNSFFSADSYKDHKKSIASARAGNVIGGGDWSANRLVPDCIKAIKKEEVINIRNPYAVRPWQHVIEPLFGYLILGMKLSETESEYAEAWNFGPESHNVATVGKLVEKIIKVAKKGSWENTSEKQKLHEANLLSLDINKAKSRLKWNPVLNFNETIEMTVEWYNKFQTNDVHELTLDQINKYLNLWKLRREN